MLQIKDTDVILNGKRYELGCDQAHAIETQLKGMSAPSAPWGFSHMSEAAACEILHRAGYELTSPYNLAENRDKTAREKPADESAAAGIPDPTNPLQEALRDRDDLWAELRDLKETIEGQDAEEAGRIKEQRDSLRTQNNRNKQRILDLEAQLTETRQRLLIARDPASEASRPVDTPTDSASGTKRSKRICNPQ